MSNTKGLEAWMPPEGSPHMFADANQWRRVLAQHQRIAIAGVPRAGKTTLSGLVKDRPVIHTDDYIKDFRGREDWGGCPERATAACPIDGRGFVIEGVRALATAKLLAKMSSLAAVTLVIWLDQPHASVRYTPEQARAAAGRRTNFAKWLREDGGKTEVVRL